MSISGDAARHFACGDSVGPDVANLQLNFWRHALDRFREIQARWRRYAIPEGGTEPEDLQYTQNEFVVDAATAIVLAGTSIAELVGQNTEAQEGRTPDIRKGLAELLGRPLRPEVEAFLAIYDALRHFGPAKHNAIWDLTEDLFCQHMETAQGIWISVLNHLDLEIPEEFQQQFAFE